MNTETNERADRRMAAMAAADTMAKLSVFASPNKFLEGIAANAVPAETISQLWRAYVDKCGAQMDVYFELSAACGLDALDLFKRTVKESRDAQRQAA